MFIKAYNEEREELAAEVVENFDFLITNNDILGDSRDYVYNILLI